MENNPFSNIIGHENACEFLRRSLKTGRRAHAYLFVGPQGVGKTAVATQFLQEFLGSKNLESHPDALVLSSEDMERESEKFTDYFRGLLGRLGMTSLGGNRKTFFIEEAHALNNNAANALLKTLEEPRGDMLIILRTHNLAAVPATIVSRCQIVRFALVAKNKIADALKKRGLDHEDAAKFSALAMGRPGHALRMVSDNAFRAEVEIGLPAILDLLEAPLPARLKSVAGFFPKGDENKKKVLEEKLAACEVVLRDLLLESVGGGNFSVHKDPRIAALAGQKNSQDLWNALLATLRVRQVFHRPINPQIALEHIILQIS